MNRERFLVVICFLVTIFSSRICHSEILPEIARIKNRHVLVVGILHEDYPPFFMKDRVGKLIGFDVELAEKIAHELGVEIRFDRSAETFNDVVELASQKKIDIAISKLSINLFRAQKVSFTNPYFYMKSAILINRLKNIQLDKASISEILVKMNHPDVSIGVVDGTTHLESIYNDFPKAKIVKFDSQEESFSAVSRGTIGFVQTHETNIKYWLYAHPEQSVKIKYLLRDDIISPLGMATSWERRDFVQWLNTFIDVVSKNGTIDKLKRYYISSLDWTKR